MPKVSVAGMSSCATIAIGWFKGQTPQQNEEYRQNKDKFKKELSACKEDLSTFYKKILYPVEQDLGETKVWQFDMLMDALATSSMKNKMTFLTLNQYQFNEQDRYWPNRLKEWGFKLHHKTKNEIGSMNYIFVRGPLSLEITKEESEYS